MKTVRLLSFALLFAAIFCCTACEDETPVNDPESGQTTPNDDDDDDKDNSNDDKDDDKDTSTPGGGDQGSGNDGSNDDDDDTTLDDFKAPDDTYAGVVTFEKAPVRKNDLYPLSDQDNKDGWVLQTQYSDEFDGTALNEEIWRPMSDGWIGRQPSRFHSSNISLKDGCLVLGINNHGDFELEEGYTHSCGFISSKKNHLYGYYEARLKANDSPWVAGFWMALGEPDWWTEIDICENCPFANPQNLASNLHVFRAPADKGNIKDHISFSKKYYVPFRIQDDFHTWGIKWDKDYVRFYFDGVLYRVQSNTYWHQNMMINVNNESNEYLGALPDGNKYTDRVYKVDYVRIWYPEK